MKNKLVIPYIIGIIFLVVASIAMAQEGPYRVGDRISSAGSNFIVLNYIPDTGMYVLQNEQTRDLAVYPTNYVNSQFALVSRPQPPTTTAPIEAPAAAPPTVPATTTLPSPAGVVTPVVTSLQEAPSIQKTKTETIEGVTITYTRSSDQEAWRPMLPERPSITVSMTAQQRTDALEKFRNEMRVYARELRNYAEETADKTRTGAIETVVNNAIEAYSTDPTNTRKEAMEAALRRLESLSVELTVKQDPLPYLASQDPTQRALAQQYFREHADDPNVINNLKTANTLQSKDMLMDLAISNGNTNPAQNPALAALDPAAQQEVVGDIRNTQIAQSLGIQWDRTRNVFYDNDADRNILRIVRDPLTGQTKYEQTGTQIPLPAQIPAEEQISQVQADIGNEYRVEGGIAIHKETGLAYQLAYNPATQKWETAQLYTPPSITINGQQAQKFEDYAIDSPQGQLAVYKIGNKLYAQNGVEIPQGSLLSKTESIGQGPNARPITVIYTYQEGKTAVAGALIEGVRVDAQTFSRIKSLIGDGSITKMDDNSLKVRNTNKQLLAETSAIQVQDQQLSSTSYYDVDSGLVKEVLTFNPDKNSEIREQYNIIYQDAQGNAITDPDQIKKMREKGEQLTASSSIQSVTYRSPEEYKETTFRSEDGKLVGETFVRDLQNNLKEYYVTIYFQPETVFINRINGIPEVSYQHGVRVKINPETGEIEECDGCTEEERKQALSMYREYQWSNFADSLWRGLEVAARGGIGRFASLFMDDEDLAKWRESVDAFLCDTIIGGGIECWSSELCKLYPDIEPSDGFVYVETPGRQLELAAHIEGERSSPISTPNGTQYFYKLTYVVRNPNEDSLKFNIQLRGQRTINIYSSWIPLAKGNTFSRILDSAIVQYSYYLYNEVCIVFDKSYEVVGDEIDETCNSLGEAAAPVQPLGAPPPAAGIPSAAAPTTEVDF